MKRLAAFALSVAVTTAAYAQRGPGGPPPQGNAPHGNPAVLAEYLSLTSGQLAAWRGIQSETRPSLETLHEQERALRDQLDDATDASAAGALVLQLRALRTQLDATRDAADAKFAALLTSEQQVKFAAFQAASEFLQRGGPAGRPRHRP